MEKNTGRYTSQIEPTRLLYSENEPETDSLHSNYIGLTNITYEFLEPPYQRFKVYLPVPVYRCRGEGIVSVDITVGQNGKVITARAHAQENYQDAECMLQVAEKYALITRFEGNLSAPRDHKARITFNFIAQ